VERRRLLAGSLAVAAVVGLGGGWWLSQQSDDGTTTLPSAGAGTIPDTGIPVATDLSGDPLPDATARTLEGSDAVTLRSLVGQPLILNFWSSTCVPCRKEMPAFEALHRSVGDRVRIVGIDPQDAPENAKAFATKVGATYELLRDADGSVTAALGVAALPTTVFIDPQGKVLKSKAGALNAEQLRSAVDSLFPS
jgi:thiol-disulfide isomerase/thioredoxin